MLKVGQLIKLKTTSAMAYGGRFVNVDWRPEIVFLVLSVNYGPSPFTDRMMTDLKLLIVAENKVCRYCSFADHPIPIDQHFDIISDV